MHCAQAMIVTVHQGICNGFPKGPKIYFRYRDTKEIDLDLPFGIIGTEIRATR